MSNARFLTPDEVAEELNTTRAQVYALIRRKDLRAVKLGGRGQWRVERRMLEEYIERLYAETDEWIDTHPFSGGEDPAGDASVQSGAPGPLLPPSTGPGTSPPPESHRDAAPE